MRCSKKYYNLFAAKLSKCNDLKTRMKDMVRTNTNGMLNNKNDQSSTHTLRKTVAKRSYRNDHEIVLLLPNSIKKKIILN